MRSSRTLNVDGDSGARSRRATAWSCAARTCARFRLACACSARRGDTDIDRFQESALFPGTPVAIVHESRDGEWWFVVSQLLRGLDREARRRRRRSASEVFAYTRKAPYLVVTGATAHTVFTPERPEVSELQLDMGVRVPVLARLAGRRSRSTASIPTPRTSSSCRCAAPMARCTSRRRCCRRTADVADDYLPLTRANLLRQSFKFLGERYGWGHSYNARDCSGFVSEVYRSFGVQLPRNTRDQGVSPALNRIAFTADDDSREAASPCCASCRSAT